MLVILSQQDIVVRVTPPAAAVGRVCHLDELQHPQCMVNSVGRLPDVLFPKWLVPSVALKRQHLMHFSLAI